MLDAVQALNGLDTRVFDAGSAFSLQHNAADAITVPDAHLLFNGEFKRVGTTGLKITGDDGTSFFIEDYFSGEKHKHLMSPEGAMLTASVVEALAGPLAPGQSAQAGAQPASQPVIGRVDALSGSCTVVRNGVSVVLNVGDTVRKGDVVQTSSASTLAIVFTDGTTFSISANARMVLNEFVYAEGGNNNSAVINLVQGTFSFIAGQVAKTGDMKVDTPVATMGIRGTAVRAEVDAFNGTTRFSVMVEQVPGTNTTTTGSFNLYDKTTGALIGTVNSSNIGWVVSPAGPLQVIAQQIQKTPAELQQELGIVQQLFTIFNNYQQNPIQQQPQQQDPDRRGDNQNGPNNSGPGGSGAPLQTGQQTTFTVTVTQIDSGGQGGAGTVPPLGGTGTGAGTGTGTGTGNPISDPHAPPPVIPLPTGTFTIINGDGVNPIIVGTAGNDHIFGTDIGETITAEQGDDEVFAAGGNDTIIAAHGEGNDFYDGGPGKDTIRYDSANGVVFHLNVASYTLPDGTVVRLSTADGADIGHDQFIRFEHVIGSPGDDIFFIHDVGDFEIDGGAGIDIVRIVGNLDLTTPAGSVHAYNVEILDLNQEFANVVNFTPEDVWVALGLPYPGYAQLQGEGGPHTTAFRILGGTTDVINITNTYQINGEGPIHIGEWRLVRTFVDPSADNVEGDVFNDHATDGVAFNVYEFVEDGQVMATVYIQNGIQIHQDTTEVTATDDFITISENQTISFDVLANDLPDFAVTRTLTHLGEATISNPANVPIGNLQFSIVNNQISVVPGTAFDALAQGQSVTISVPYTMEIDGGQTLTAVATITITGTNDQPVVTGGTSTGTVTAGQQNNGGGDYPLGNHELVSGLGGDSGFGEFFLGRNDDGSTGAINITSIFGEGGLNFFGNHYTSIYINNNGNITFNGPLGTYTPSQIAGGSGNPIIAAFWADVDTRGGGVNPTSGGHSTGSNLVWYDLDSVNRVLTITWDDVGYFDSHTNLLNAFQLQLIDRGNGDFDIVFRYEDINWTAGDASGGAGGLGGTPARAGYTAGDGNAQHYFELPGSGTEGGMLGLEGATNTGVPGVYVFHVRNGGVTESETSGTITFSDVDVIDTHSVTSGFNAAASGRASALGTLIASLTHDTVNGTGGVVTWEYNIDPDVLNQLAPGTVLTEVFDVVISDGHGGTITQQVTVTVNGPDGEAENHRPALHEDASPMLDSIAQGTGLPVGAVGTLVSHLVDLDTTQGGLDNVTDPDANAQTGIAIYGNPGTFGKLYYSIDGGEHWTQVGEVSDGHALLLAANSQTRLYFQPAGNFSGTIDDLFTFRAWDQTEGTNGQYFDIGMGGANTTSVSSAPDHVGLTVNPAGGAPVIHIDQAMTTEGEQSTTLSGLYVTDPDEQPGEHYDVRVTALHGSLQLATPGHNLSDADESPSVMQFDDAPLSMINEALRSGVIYTNPVRDPDNPNVTDRVTLTVTDESGHSDIINFIFSVFGETGAALTGTTGRDVLFSTGHSDTLSGSGGRDTFIFGRDNAGGGPDHDVITDMTLGDGPNADVIELIGFSPSDVTFGQNDNGDLRILLPGDQYIDLAGIPHTQVLTSQNLHFVLGNA